MILKTQRAIVRKAEKRIKKRLSSDFRTLANNISKRLDQIEQRSWVDDIDQIIELSWAKSVQWLGEDLYHLYRLGARYINKFAQGGVELDKINILAVKWIQDLKSLHLKNIDGSILHTTLQETKKIIADGVFDGKTYKQIGQEIIAKTEAGYLAPSRAERIAINTVGNAYEQGRKEAITQLTHKGQRVEKIRDTVGDDRVTRQCRENENKGRIPFKASFPSGDSEAPRSGNPRCRCSTNYRIL